MGSVLKATFAAETAHVDSDMLAAARAPCGSEPGIACILGTGSNSCLCDGRRITANTPPMGFILATKAAAPPSAKPLLTGIFKRRLPQSVISLFTDRYPEADKAEVIRNVYRGERPAAYLASIRPLPERAY